MDPFLLKIKWKNTPLLLIVKRRTGEPGEQADGCLAHLTAYIKDGGRLAFPSRVQWLPINHPLIK
jgi:hypothetical protein